MAKKYYKPPIHQVGTAVTTKTHFGSSSDMIIDHSKYTVDNSLVDVKDNEIVCKDDKGFYVTYKNRIDSGLADPNRYANSKFRIFLQEKLEKNDQSS
jgi:hypothetical protein